MEKKPLLSVVATSRNDDHGKNLLYRMRHFSHGFIEQCKRHQLDAELIIVEWNPPEEKARLLDVLDLPKDTGPCSIRIISVPKSLHEKCKYSDQLPLFQMIGKNVGIQRAKGRFVLATNIDILFSNPLMQFFKTGLKEGYFYRVNRFDIPEILPETTSYDELLDFCRKNVFRINHYNGTAFVKKSFLSRLLVNPLPKLFKLYRTLLHSSLYSISYIGLRVIYRILKKINILLFPNHVRFLHTNACGDFTLLAKRDWENLKGYPEWEMYSWHIDSVLLHQARQHGLKQKILPKKYAIYHIEHTIGSGYAPEHASALFDRLRTKGIPYLSNQELNEIINRLKAAANPVIYNQSGWGFKDYKLEEMRP